MHVSAKFIGLKDLVIIGIKHLFMKICPSLLISVRTLYIYFKVPVS